MSFARLSSVLLIALFAAGSQSPAAATVARTLAHPVYQRAAAALERGYQRLIQDTIALTEIPAPTFDETARGDAFMAMLRAAGLGSVERDAAGNVMGLWRGSGGSLIAIAAHLDTVFPAGTDVRVRRDGTRLSAPGIGDNAQSLAVLLAIVRAMREAGARTSNDILFVGTVGEEGAGDLRGVKHLFAHGKYGRRIGMFVAVDGVGDAGAITTSGVGSRRYRISFRGPGGHSYGGFGLVNPAFALTGAVERLGALKVTSSPKTTFNVGRLGGGTAINAIPTEAWMEVDLRSEAVGPLQSLEADVLDAARRAAAEENRTRSTAEGPIEVDVTLIGSRAAGHTALGTTLVQVAVHASRAMGINPSLVGSSTDANLPMSLGVPAIAIDSGVRGGRAHAPDEWIDVDRRVSFSGLPRTLLLVLSLAGLE